MNNKDIALQHPSTPTMLMELSQADKNNLESSFSQLHILLSYKYTALHLPAPLWAALRFGS